VPHPTDLDLTPKDVAELASPDAITALLTKLRYDTADRRRFTDGNDRDVFLDADGQYVLGDDGRKVRGVWLLTDQEEAADVPLVVMSGLACRGVK
jgi:hypothetical protein